MAGKEQATVEELREVVEYQLAVRSLSVRRLATQEIVNTLLITTHIS